MMCVWAHRQHSHAARLMWSTEWIPQRRRARCKARLGSEACIQARRPGHVRRGASRTRILRHRQSAIILHQLVVARFKNDAVVVDAIPATDRRLAFADRIIDKANPGAKV